MAKGPAFDTLKYVKILRKGSIANSEIFSEALADAISQNIYIKNEVDKMIEAALKEFHQRTIEMREQMREQMREEAEKRDQERKEYEKRHEESQRQFQEWRLEMKLEMKDIRAEMEQITNRAVTRVTINLGVIIATLNLISLAVHFLH